MLTSVTRMMLQMVEKRERLGNLRTLDRQRGAIDFSSNDYLGLSTHPQLLKAVFDGLKSHNRIGSTGSRLISGHSQLADDLENRIATCHGAEAGLLFSTGYLANLGLMSTLAGANDLYLYDERIHMSLREGIKGSKAHSETFNHNSPEALEVKLSKASGFRNLYVIAESIYSCDGSLAPLREIEALCTRYRASLIVDEAHSTGVFGPNGLGAAQAIKGSPSLLATVHTFGKAVGAFGAIVLGSKLLKTYLLNHCPTQIYTTMLPYPILYAIKEAYELFPSLTDERRALCRRISYFKSKAATFGSILIDSDTAIQTLLTGSARRLASICAMEGFDIGVMTFPTVPRGKERLRICLHSYNTEDEIDALIASLEKHLCHH